MDIHWRNLEGIPEQARRSIETRLERLARDQTDLIDVRITVRAKRATRGPGEEVRVASQVGGREIVAARTRPELALALNDAVDAFEREVRRLQERRRPAGTGRGAPRGPLRS